MSRLLQVLQVPSTPCARGHLSNSLARPQVCCLPAPVGAESRAELDSIACGTGPDQPDLRPDLDRRRCISAGRVQVRRLRSADPPGAAAAPAAPAAALRAAAALAAGLCVCLRPCLSCLRPCLSRPCLSWSVALMVAHRLQVLPDLLGRLRGRPFPHRLLRLGPRQPRRRSADFLRLRARW